MYRMVSTPAVMLTCRCRDLPEHMVAQARFNRIVMVVPGGSDTIQCWEACLSALGQALGKLSEGEHCTAALARTNVV